MNESFGLSVKEFIKTALKEDVGDGDHTTLACVDEATVGKAVVKAKEQGIIAGVELAKQILEEVDKTILVKTLKQDGDEVVIGEEVILLEGSIPNILKAERLLLNCMQRMSGIATKTKTLVKLIEGTPAKLLDTRKTTPNFRMFEKQAVRLGGGYNHRFGLYDMILIKDNHVDACGGIEPAIKRANEYLKKINKNLIIEIETRNLNEVSQVIATGGVNRIMLDNFSLADLKKAILLIDRRYESEASGGITEENIRAIAETGVDFISIGALTHSYKSLDISLKISK
jgi:nicotinate-nucleotide pyrophosphorylase (carboxylating)